MASDDLSEALEDQLPVYPGRVLKPTARRVVGAQPDADLRLDEPRDSARGEEHGGL